MPAAAIGRRRTRPRRPDVARVLRKRADAGNPEEFFEFFEVSLVFAHGSKMEKLASAYSHAHQQVDSGEESISAAARAQSGGLVSLGRGGVRKGPPGGQADLPFHRLLDLPLVPRDGARVVRERADRGDSEPSIRGSIKVDREERPDVDRIYMHFVQATTGGGGWPMSVWLTPELKPFFGGTYFPPDNRYGRPGFGIDARTAGRGLARADGARSWSRASTSSSSWRSTRAWPPADARVEDGAVLEIGLLSHSAAPSTRDSAASARRRSFRARRC